MTASNDDHIIIFGVKHISLFVFNLIFDLKIGAILLKITCA